MTPSVITRVQSRNLSPQIIVAVVNSFLPYDELTMGRRTEWRRVYTAVIALSLAPTRLKDMIRVGGTKTGAWCDNKVEVWEEGNCKVA